MRPGQPVGPHRTGPVPDWAAAGATMSLLAGKWVIAALSTLASGPRRHGAVYRSIGSGISDKVLTETLRRMQRNGLLTRRVVDTDGQVAVRSRPWPAGPAPTPSHAPRTERPPAPRPRADSASTVDCRVQRTHPGVRNERCGAHPLTLYTCITTTE
jgi:DNA-binding HxlR family transcriptional regulator